MIPFQGAFGMTADTVQATVRARSPFYIQMGLIALTIALSGFFLTYFLPLSEGRFDAPFIVHLHGIAAFAWLLIFLIQPALIRFGRFPVHRALGMAGLVVAATVMVGGIGTSFYAVERDLAAGRGDLAVADMPGTWAGMFIFFGLVLAAILYRHKPEVHKRLMLLATLALLWPAWFRLRHVFPAIPYPEITLAILASDALILAAMVRDRLVEGRVHPVYLFAGTAIILEHVLEFALYGSPAWISLARFLYGLGGG